MDIKIRVPYIAAGLALLLVAGAAFAGSASDAGQSEPSKEMRAKMATLHEQMAACLRSDKTMTECRSEMRKHCQETMGKDHCSMMDRGGGMMGHRMHSDSSSSSDQKQ